MPVLEQNRTHDLGLDISVNNPTFLMRYTPMTTEMQANLRQDVKALAAEYLEHLNAPQIQPDAWASANVEFISEDTKRYIQQMESLLQEAANDTNDEAFADRITAVLR